MNMEFKFKKKYGQNFLIDKNIVNKIVSLCNISNNSLVIEIGCGDGRLTEKLCSCFDNVLGYEIDTEVESKLYSNLEKFSNYKIIFDDFMNRDVNKDLSRFKYDQLYIISNLPYYITTPIITKIIDSNINVSQMILMVQKEVGERFCAKPGNKEYGSLSVYLNYFFDVKKEFIVNRNSFFPVPNVDSVIVSFKNKDKIFLKDNLIFLKLVKDSFKYKRKTLSNNLKGYDLKKIANVLKKYNLDLNVRAENISLNIFCDIANSLSI